MSQMLDKLDVIECFEEAGDAMRIDEILTKQQEIYKALDVAVPTSS